MRTIRLFLNRWAAVPVCAALLSLACFTSCSDDDKVGSPSFEIEGDATGYTVSFSGNTVGQQFVVRSNGDWKFVRSGDESWARVFPEEGSEDGIFKVIVQENTTFTSRSMSFRMFVNGQEQPTMFTVNQEAAVPYIDVAESAKGLTITNDEQDMRINISANVTWEYKITQDVAEPQWLTFASLTNNNTLLTLHAADNTGGKDRFATVTVYNTQYDIEKTVRIKQGVILAESFDFLIGKGWGAELMWQTAPAEKRLDQWPAGTAPDNWGWTTEANTAGGATVLVYARPGYIKFGKTGYGGNITSPKLTGIPEGETMTIELSFKAVGYISAGGTKDANSFIVNVLGAGKPESANFTIDNYPDNTNAETGHLDCWKDEVALRKLVIEGATSETRIQFVAGPEKTESGSNRIFLDDIVIVAK